MPVILLLGLSPFEPSADCVLMREFRVFCRTYNLVDSIRVWLSVKSVGHELVCEGLREEVFQLFLLSLEPASYLIFFVNEHAWFGTEKDLSDDTVETRVSVTIAATDIELEIFCVRVVSC